MIKVVNPRLCRGLSMFDIYGNIKEPPVSEPLKVQATGGKNVRREKSKP
jgi:hypothetical protein